MSRWLVTSAFTAALATAGYPVLADDQQQPQQPSDIGRVSAGGRGSEEQTVVKPNATTSRAAAIEEKKEAPNIVDVQPLSEIIKLPDVNTAEALQRIPGISLETDSGEGRFVHIRGLDADLNGTTYGGVRLPASNESSPSGGERAVAFDTFPTGIVGGIEVTKTLRPDMDAEGLGGTINLVPRTGAEHGGAPFVDVDLGGGLEELRDTPVYHAEASMGRSFDGGDGIGGLFAGKNAFSAVLSVVYHQDKRGIDDIEEDYDDAQSSGVPDRVLQDLQFRRYEYERRRYGIAANFDARATETTSFYVRLLYSGYLESADKHYLVLDNLNGNDGCSPLPSCIQNPSDPQGFISGPSGQLEQDTTDSLERIQNGLGIIGGSSVFSAFKLDYHASFAIGTDLTSTDYGSTFLSGNVPIAYDNVRDSRFPTFSVLNGVNPANPANYTLTDIGLGPSLTHDGETAAAVDATIPIGSADHSGEWKTGLSLRQRHRYNDQTSLDFDPSSLPASQLSLANFTYGPDQIYYNNLYNIGPAISLPAIRNIVAQNPLLVTQPDPAGDIAGDTDDVENVYAVYVQYQQRFGAAGVLAGVRVEHTDASYSGFLFNKSADDLNPADLSLTTVSNSYTNVFPTVQFRYDFQPDLVGRVTYSTGIARPGFEQITPGVNFKPNQTSSAGSPLNIGNPDLKPTTGQSFDGTLEWYPGDGQIASLGLFYKIFQNYILMQEQSVADYRVPGTSIDLGPQVLGTFVNGPAHADGVEGQYEQKLQWLPAPFDGLGYSLNFTLVDSKAQIHPGIEGLLPSTSKVTWNAALFYERGPLAVRLAADYVGKNLFAFGSTLGDSTDVYSLARLTMDLGTSYAFAHNVSVYFDAKNLLNTPLAFTEGPDTSRYIQREFYDATFLLGVRLSL